MGILADIGRSNIGHTSSDLLRGANDLVRTQAYIQQQDVENRMNNLKLQEMEKEQARLNSPYNVRLSPLLTAFDPDTPEFEEAYKYVRHVSGANDDGITTLGDYQKGREALAQDEKMMSTLVNAKMNKMILQRNALAEKAENARSIGDADTFNKLSAQVTAFDDRINTASGKKQQFDLEMAKLKESNAQKEADRASRESIADENRKSREMIAEESRKSQERIAEDYRQLRRDLEKNSNKVSPTDRVTVVNFGRQLVKTRDAARTADKNLLKIDRMLGLIDEGKGGVQGNLLAKINRITDALSVTPPESAKYNQLRQELMGFAGQLRLSLGLVGQTSDRDVNIMQEAAGMASPAEAQRAILLGYRQQFEQDVLNYNEDAQTYSQMPGITVNPYKTIPIRERKAGASGVKSFASEADADAAAKRGEIKAGDRISIGGQSGTWR